MEVYKDYAEENMVMMNFRLLFGSSVFITLSVMASLSFAEDINSSVDEETLKRAKITCLKIGATTQAQKLERTNMIIDFGITDPDMIEITRGYIEMSFIINDGSCVKNILHGLLSPLNK